MKAHHAPGRTPRPCRRNVHHCTRGEIEQRLLGMFQPLRRPVAPTRKRREMLRGGDQ